MAVLGSFPGLTAEILINGLPAPEIDDMDDIQVEHEDPTVRDWQISRTVSKYIKSETSQRFSVKLTAGPPFVTNKFMEYVKLGFHVYVDGKYVGTKWLSRLWFKKNEAGAVWEEEMKGVIEGKGGACTLKEFRFAELATRNADGDPAENAQVKRLAQRIKAVGTIEIRVFNETAGKKGGNTNASSKGFLDTRGTTVPEQALKGDTKSHGTALATAKSAKRGDFFTNKIIGREDMPKIIFRFLYRGEDDLKAMHVINRKSSSSPSPFSSPIFDHIPEPRNANGLTAAQQAQVDENIRAMAIENQLKEVAARQAREASTTDQKKIKRERSSEWQRENNRVAKKARSRNGGQPEFIDLSGDTDGEDKNEGTMRRGLR